MKKSRDTDTRSVTSQEEATVVARAKKALDQTIDDLPSSTQDALGLARKSALRQGLAQDQADKCQGPCANSQRLERVSLFSRLRLYPLQLSSAVALGLLIVVLYTVSFSPRENERLSIEDQWVLAPKLDRLSRDGLSREEGVLELEVEEAFFLEMASLSQTDWEAVEELEFAYWLSELDDDLFSMDQSG